MDDLSAVESIFFAALDRSSPAERAAYLDQACGADAELRRQVEKLLAAQPNVGRFLQGPVADLAGTVDVSPAPEGAGSRIGPYKLLQQIGEGGMGIVWMAEQTQPVQRKVALKFVKPGMDSRQVLARFEAERQALAMMNHQNIARVLDAGSTAAGRPYFVMELVHGVAITKFCDDSKLTPRQRLELFVPVCHAVQHAHTKGVIHRDLKPSNILVTMYDDKPVPKVIDFGVAKAIDQRLTEKSLFTHFGTLVGTFEYMSPEQAEMNAFGVDTRSDVYSLGVLLYELLTGTTPLEKEQLQKAALDEFVRLIREEEPPRPSARLSSSDTLAKVAAARHTEPARLPGLVRGELDWIVMKCLEKDRARRYETANDLARDVERHLRDEPVEACPPSTRYRLHKFLRKHRTGAWTAAVFAALLLVGAGVSAGLTVWALHAEQEARDSAAQARAEAELKEQARQKAVTNEARAVKFAAAAWEARQEANRRLEQIELANTILAAVFRDLFPQAGEKEAPLLRRQLNQRLEEAAAQLDGTDKADPRTLARLQDALGKALSDFGQPRPAVELLQKALATRKALLGPDHLDTLTTRTKLAGAYLAAGKADAALALLEKTLPLLKARLGIGHPDTLNAAQLFTQAAMTLQRFEQVEPVWRQLAEYWKYKAGPDSLSYAEHLGYLGACLIFQQKPRYAEPILRQSLDLLARKSPDAWRTFHVRSLLGLTLLSRKKYVEAEPLLLDGYQGLKQREATIPLASRGTVIAALERVVRLYTATGQKDKAAAWRKRLAEARAAAKKLSP